MLRGTAVPDGLGSFRVDGALPLLLPVEGSPGVRHGIVHVPGVGNLLGDVSGVGGNPGGDDALLHIVHIGQGQMLGGGYITQERRAGGCRDGTADGGGDVVIAGGNVRDDGAQNVEGAPMQMVCWSFMLASI